MINLNDFKRLITPIRKKLYLIIGRAILLAVTNSGKYQIIKISAGAGNILNDVERMQEYGLDSYPKVSETSEALCLSPNGNRESAVVIKVQDRETRPTDLNEGEVILYTHEDSGGSHRIHLKAGQEIEIKGSTITIIGGGASTTGVVTGECICAYTGNPHPDVSTTVKASK